MKIDVIGYKNQVFSKTWYVNQVIDNVETPYDMTTKTLVLKIFDRSTPMPVELYSKDPVAKGLGYITFQLAITETTSEVPVDYQILEDPGSAQILIHYGTISFANLGKYIAFKDLVAHETPEGLEIPENFITIKSYEWRLFLQNAIVPNIADEDITDETAWPVLVNMLIAKLVVYQYLEKQLFAPGATNGSDGGAGGTSGITKIVTGPAEVQFGDTASPVWRLLQKDKNGLSLMTTMASDACQLAKRLTIYLPICDNMDQGLVIPLKQGRPCPPSLLTILTTRL